MSSRQSEPDVPVELNTVVVTLCDLCLEGAGGECHTPGCGLYMNRAPDVPLLYTPIRGGDGSHA